TRRGRGRRPCRGPTGRRDGRGRQRRLRAAAWSLRPISSPTTVSTVSRSCKPVNTWLPITNIGTPLTLGIPGMADAGPRSGCAAVYEVGCQASSGAFADSSRLARTVRAAALGAVVSLPLSSTAFFSRRRAPRCGPDTSPRSAGVSSARAQRPDYRLSVRDRPRPQAPFTVYALGVRHASIESPPIERTVPSQGSPGGRTAALSDLTGPHRCGAAAPSASPANRSCLPSTRASHRRRPPPGGLAPCRRVHRQAPVLRRRPLRPLAPLQVAPQRDQQLPRQGHDADLPRPLVPRAEAPRVPLAQRTPRLPTQPQPGQLHDQAAHVFVAGLADPLVAFTPAAVIRHRRQAHQRPQLLAALDAAPG